jgi:hypothetical protein
MAAGQSIAGGLAYKNNRDAQKATAKANAELTRRMEQGRQDYLARRPQAAEERMKALRAQLGLLGPLNKLTQEMGGGGDYSLDFGQVANESPLAMTPLQSQLYQTDAYGKPVLGPNGKPLPATQAALSKLAEQGYSVPGIRRTTGVK